MSLRDQSDGERAQLMLRLAFVLRVRQLDLALSSVGPIRDTLAALRVLGYRVGHPLFDRPLRQVLR
jgi:hypothetical protein